MELRTRASRPVRLKLLGALIELPPVRIPAAAFEAARNRAELPSETAALLDRWYAAESSAAGKSYQLRRDEPLDDSGALALAKFWKSERLPLVRLAYPDSPLPKADIRRAVDPVLDHGRVR